MEYFIILLLRFTINTYLQGTLYHDTYTVIRHRSISKNFEIMLLFYLIMDYFTVEFLITENIEPENNL